jgi:tripartite-type tricarboxylate transporter receptor subunit TctC
MRSLLNAALLAAMLWGLPICSARAQTFPSTTVVIIVPYPAGGSTDVLARAVASELAKLWKQSVVVENVGGASSIIGSNRVATAAPDGHTLLLTIDPTVVSNRFLFKKLPYDPDKSLTPITMLGRSGQLLIAHPSVAAKDLRALVDAARRNPGGIAYGSYGAGTQPNLLFETLAEREKVKFLQVPYKGIAPVVTAVTAGEVQVSVASPAASGAMVKADKIKALAIGGMKRSSLFPEVPTMREQGYPYIDSVIWWGMFAPGGTSAALVDRIHRDVASVAKQPNFIAKYFAAFGIDPIVDTPAEFAASIRSDVQATAEMVKAAGVQPVE